MRLAECLWEPNSHSTTNSTADIAEYKSHTLSLCCVQDALEKLRPSLLFFGSGRKKREAEGSVICLTLWVLCLCFYVFTCDYLAAWCHSVASAGWFAPLGNTAQAKRSDKVTSAALSEWMRINKLTLCTDASSPLKTRASKFLNMLYTAERLSL